MGRCHLGQLHVRRHPRQLLVPLHRAHLLGFRETMKKKKTLAVNQAVQKKHCHLHLHSKPAAVRRRHLRRRHVWQLLVPLRQANLWPRKPQAMIAFGLMYLKSRVLPTASFVDESTRYHVTASKRSGWTPSRSARLLNLKTLKPKRPKTLKTPKPRNPNRP